MKLQLVIATMLIQTIAGADVLIEDFSTLNKFSSSTAVWNISSGVLHSTVQIANWKKLGGDTLQNTDFDVGDGSHGSFELATYANFGTVVGTVITVNTETYPVLKFTKFQLDAGYQLVGSGSNPLRIYSQSTMMIAGTILCTGGAGSAGTTAGAGAGGVARCGGSQGGNGGGLSSSGNRGLPTTGLATAGFGGSFTSGGGGAGGSGGGGGGAVSTGSPFVGVDSNPANNIKGAAGTSSENHQFSSFEGGAGGGGGSGSTTEGGSGGGAGGGVIVLHAVGDITVSSGGFVLAKGGAGGGSVTGGGGGGGGGGSIQIFTAGALTLTSGTSVLVAAGAAGVASSGTAGSGGLGAFGRTWLSSATFAGSGSEDNISALFALGTGQYSSGTLQSTISKSYDSQSTLSKVISITISPSSSDAALSVKASSDDFVSDDSGWVAASQAASITNKRYLKFKLDLTNSSSASPTKITELSITHSPGQKEDFKFKSGCGLIRNSSPPSSGNMLLLLGLFFLPLLIGIILKPISEKTGHSS